VGQWIPLDLDNVVAKQELERGIGPNQGNLWYKPILMSLMPKGTPVMMIGESVVGASRYLS
jgi:hypothetical protein